MSTTSSFYIIHHPPIARPYSLGIWGSWFPVFLFSTAAVINLGESTTKYNSQPMPWPLRSLTAPSPRTTSCLWNTCFSHSLLRSPLSSSFPSFIFQLHQKSNPLTPRLHCPAATVFLCLPSLHSVAQCDHHSLQTPTPVLAPFLFFLIGAKTWIWWKTNLHPPSTSPQAAEMVRLTHNSADWVQL